MQDEKPYYIWDINKRLLLVTPVLYKVNSFIRWKTKKQVRDIEYHISNLIPVHRMFYVTRELMWKSKEIYEPK